MEAIRNSSIELVLTRHEQAAAFMAATYGRLTGNPGVCITTLGPGALNLTTGAAYALLGGMPLIMITGQKGVLSSHQARFQMVNTVATMQPLTKMSRQIVSPSMIPTIVREAFHLAQEECPGPVHLELPEDIAAEKSKKVALIPPHPIEYPIASETALNRAAEMIMQAKRPLVMLGAAAYDQEQLLILLNLFYVQNFHILLLRWVKGLFLGQQNFIWALQRFQSGIMFMRL